MTTDLEKIRRLLERAAHASTPVEEARTSAVIAARLIIEHEVELYLPGQTPRRGRGLGDIFEASDLDEVMSDFFRNMWPDGRPGRPAPKRQVRQTFTALCPGELHLSCTCCGAQVRPGSRLHYASDPLIDGDTVARVTHDGCAAHWMQKRCSSCGKNTTKRLREKITNQRRDPPGTTMSTTSGFCYCCGQTYDVDEKIVSRGFVCVHVKCYPHFNRSPCPKCGGGARF